jgi:hypothetical protein
VSPPFVRIAQRPSDASNLAADTSVPNRMCGIGSYFSAQRSRYAWISGCGLNFRDQSWFGSKEKE